MFEYIVNDPGKTIRRITVSEKTVTMYTFGIIDFISENLKAKLLSPNKLEFQVGEVIYEGVYSNDPEHTQAHKNIAAEQYTSHSHLRRKDRKPLTEEDIKNILEIFLVDKNDSHFLPPETIADIINNFKIYQEKKLADYSTKAATAENHSHEEKIYTYIENRSKEETTIFGIKITGKLEKIKEKATFSKEEKLRGAEWIENNQKKIIAKAGKAHEVDRFEEHEKVLTQNNSKLKEVFDDFCQYSKEERISQLSSATKKPR